ncbi:DUF1707 SHOCT-like domain-containing protein [Nocardia crassostreae]|uniref:DUF1707 SHOCT-like domain-containing protein n=1 Tax=Nocardia crassostreae TaxID=53428 RepID=UPI0008338D04|nr:DUF1707 domain-containing protein [Nocardia crassostreae]
MGGPESVSGADATAVGDRDLRVSDVEREHVERLLQRAVGLGMLSLGEFTERMDTALAAKTRGELNAVLVDLPGIRLAGQPAPAAQPYPSGRPPFGPAQARFAHAQARMAHAQQRFAHVQQRFGALPGGTQQSATGHVIRARLTGLTRKGTWQVPPVLVLNDFMGSVTLDFTQAVMSTQVVEIQVDDVMTSIELIVPSEATVDLNGLDIIGGSINNKVRTGPPMGPLHLVVHGRLRLGSVTAKHPFAAQWKRFFTAG